LYQQFNLDALFDVVSFSLFSLQFENLELKLMFLFLSRLVTLQSTPLFELLAIFPKI